MGRDRLVGAAYAVAAFGTWGLAPAYWHRVDHVPRLEVVAHRVLWSLPVLFALVARRRRLAEVGRALADPRHRRVLAGTGVLIAANWLLFVWAIARERVLEASLGYYVSPLVMVLLGVAFLGERLTRRQGAAVALAAAGVAWLTASHGEVPWAGLALAGTFALYGLLRKTAGVDALVGLSAETTLLAPVAAAAVAVFAARGESGFLARGWGGAGLLALSGLVTSLPLLWSVEAARRLRYVSLGFFQYLAPTLQLLLAVFAFGEHFTRAHGVAFSLIGAAALLYAWPGPGASRAKAPPTAVPPEE